MRLKVSTLVLGLSLGLSANNVNLPHDMSVLTSSTPFPSGGKTYVVQNYKEVSNCFDSNTEGLKEVTKKAVDSIGGKSAYAIKWATGLGQNYENLAKMTVQKAFDYQQYLNLSFMKGSDFEKPPKDLVHKNESGNMKRVKVDPNAYYLTYTGINLKIPLVGGYTFASTPKVISCPIKVKEVAMVCEVKK